MIFNRTFNLKTSKSVSDIKSILLGKHFTIHKIDFEILEHNGIIRCVPHAEQLEGERILTLPVCRIETKNNSVKLKTHPRRTDIGGPMLLMIACILFFIVGLILLYKGSDDVRMAAFIMVGVSFVVGLLFWIKMELGYFDYVTKIKNNIKGML